MLDVNTNCGTDTMIVVSLVTEEDNSRPFIIATVVEVIYSPSIVKLKGVDPIFSVVIPRGRMKFVISGFGFEKDKRA